MNANELAKGLSQNKIYGDDYGLFNKRIQNMLRQQQAEIEVLKSVVYWLKENRPEVWNDIKKWRKL